MTESQTNLNHDIDSGSDFASPKEEIIQIAKSLHGKDLLAAADGNISYKKDDGTLIITPSGVAKNALKPNDFAHVTIEGQVLSGHPSSEIKMHLKVYQNCPKAKAVIHAHPPTAVAWTIARPQLTELPSECLSEMILACGSIPVVPFALPGTNEMAEVLDSYIPKNRVMILSRHGALCWGEDLKEAHRGIERLEHISKILYLAENLGGLSFLPPNTVEQLKAMRTQIGEKIL